MKKLFTNEIKVLADKEMVRQLLLDANYLMRWNPTIGQVEGISDNKFVLYRNQMAVNQQEVISIHQETNKIIYQSDGKNFSYTLVFRIESDESQMVRVSEDFFVIEVIKILPLSLLKPVIQRAFNKNLLGFKNLAEQVTKM